MNSITVSCIIFACLVAGTILGIILRARLPEHHLSPESRDIIKLGMGLVGTMTALVLGLLVASAKGSFDTQRNGLAQLAGNVVFLDRVLAHYGTESKDLRDTLRASVTDLIERTWPHEKLSEAEASTGTAPGRYEGFYDKIQDLSPRTEIQRTAQAQAMKTALDLAQTRWLLFAQKGNSIPTPFLVVVVSWLALIMASFSLFAPPNATTFVTLLICALTISSSIFLILELDRPFGGVIQISSDSLRNALAQLGP